MKTLISRRFATTVGTACLAMLAVGCASSASSSSPSGSTATATQAARPSASSPASAIAPAVATKALLKTENTKIGTVLTDAKGLTLYWFAMDTPTSSACTGACADAWPPVTGVPQAAAGIKLTGKLGEIKRPDGTLQATYNGHPLYAFQGDHAAGQINGNGLTGFGARWSVINLTSKSAAVTPAVPPAVNSPAPATRAPASTPPATSAPTGGGGGYGY